jgi:hypothetical protein
MQPPLISYRLIAFTGLFIPVLFALKPLYLRFKRVDGQMRGVFLITRRRQISAVSFFGPNLAAGLVEMFFARASRKPFWPHFRTQETCFGQCQGIMFNTRGWALWDRLRALQSKFRFYRCLDIKLAGSFRLGALG